MLTSGDCAGVMLPGPATPSRPGKETVWRALPATSSASAGAGPIQGGVRHGMFWKASSGNNTAYLLGSIHAATPELYPLPGAD